jgi:hypothetical protein
MSRSWRCAPPTRRSPDGPRSANRSSSSGLGPVAVARPYRTHVRARLSRGAGWDGKSPAMGYSHTRGFYHPAPVGGSTQSTAGRCNGAPGGQGVFAESPLRVFESSLQRE